MIVFPKWSTASHSFSFLMRSSHSIPASFLLYSFTHSFSPLSLLFPKQTFQPNDDHPFSKAIIITDIATFSWLLPSFHSFLIVLFLFSLSLQSRIFSDWVPHLPGVTLVNDYFLSPHSKWHPSLTRSKKRQLCSISSLRWQCVGLATAQKDFRKDWDWGRSECQSRRMRDENVEMNSRQPSLRGVSFFCFLLLSLSLFVTLSSFLCPYSFHLCHFFPSKCCSETRQHWVSNRSLSCFPE